MSLPIDVSDLIHQKKVERTRIEYKSGWNPEPIIHTITAFANDFDNMAGGINMEDGSRVNASITLTNKALANIDESEFDLEV